MTRTVLAVLAALVVAAPAAGVSRGAHDPQKRLNARDQAKARSFLLRPADLGSSWTSTPAPHAGDGGDLSCAGFDPDLSDLVETGDVQSRLFVHATASTSSTVFSTGTVYANARMAGAAWNRVIRPELVRCLSTLLEGTSTAGVGFKTVSSGRLDFPHVAPRTAAFRLAVEAKALGATVRFYLDLIALGSGRLEAGIFAVSLRRPLDESLERSLARAVARRLR